MLQLKNIYKSYITGGSRQIALDGINLKVLNIYNYMTFDLATEKSEKAVFVCRKE